MMQIDSELVRLLMRIGYAAAWKGLYREALAVFRGVGAVRPDSEVPLIGVAMIGMLAKDFDMASRALDRAREAHPENDLVKAHWGCLLRLKGSDEEGLAVLNALAAESADPNARAMAERVKDLPADELFSSR